MLVKKLIEKMSEIIIDTLDTKGHAGHASRIINFGHFSPKMFSPGMFFRCKPETSVRMAINIFYEIGEEKADELVMKVYLEFKKLVFGDDSIIDRINNEHASKKKKKK